MNYLRLLHLRSNQPQLLVMHRLEVSHDLSHTHRSGGLDQWVEQFNGHQFASHFVEILADKPSTVTAYLDVQSNY